MVPSLDRFFVVLDEMLDVVTLIHILFGQVFKSDSFLSASICAFCDFKDFKERAAAPSSGLQILSAGARCCWPPHTLVLYDHIIYDVL